MSSISIPSFPHSFYVKQKISYDMWCMGYLLFEKYYSWKVFKFKNYMCQVWKFHVSSKVSIYWMRQNSVNISLITYFMWGFLALHLRQTRWGFDEKSSIFLTWWMSVSPSPHILWVFRAIRTLSIRRSIVYLHKIIPLCQKYSATVFEWVLSFVAKI